MTALGKIVEKIPVISFLYKALRRKNYRLQLRSKDKEKVFTAIYKANKWGGESSVSGPGSDTHQTKRISKKLPELLNKFNIKKMLDIPCGDFHWMVNVDLSNIEYIGADVVKELIVDNIDRHTEKNIHFQHLNLIQDKLPDVDLVFCRDCLVHFSYADAFLALENICNSQSEYLLTTTFVDRNNNYDISTGQWHPVNLELSPFDFPKPLLVIMEECTEGGDLFADKALGLWNIKDIQEHLVRKL